MWPTPIVRRRGRPTEGNELRLGGMDRQAVLIEPLWHDVNDTLGVATIAEPNHEIVRIADKKGRAILTKRVSSRH